MKLRFQVISRDTAERAGEPAVAYVNFDILDLNCHTVRGTLYLNGKESELSEFKAGEFYTVDIQNDPSLTPGEWQQVANKINATISGRQRV